MTTLTQQATRGARIRASIGRGPAFHTSVLRTRCAECGEVHGNERGDDNDPGQIVVDLISNDASPFKPEHADALRMMGTPALMKLRDKFIGPVVNVAIHANASDEDVVAMSTGQGLLAAHFSAGRAALLGANADKTVYQSGGRNFIVNQPRPSRTPAPPLGSHHGARPEQADPDELAGMNTEGTRREVQARRRR